MMGEEASQWLEQCYVGRLIQLEIIYSVQDKLINHTNGWRYGTNQASGQGGLRSVDSWDFFNGGHGYHVKEKTRHGMSSYESFNVGCG